MEKVDITGTMATPIEGWQERVEKLAKPGGWGVEISMSRDLFHALTAEELLRLDKKVAMIAEATKWMLAAMVKGTLKYTSDDWTVDRWMAHLIGEGADQMNYQILLFNAWQKQKQEEEDAIARTQRAWEEKK